MKQQRGEGGLTRAGDLLKAGDLMKAKAPKKSLAVGILPKETKDASTATTLQPQAFDNPQLNLFASVLGNTDAERDQFSNAIDLWDSVPRYAFSRQAMVKMRVNEVYLPKHEAVFQHRGRAYTRVIMPALVTDHDGIERYYYPSANEELVEDALRKIATEQQAGYFDKPNYRSGVVFTTYLLREELKKRGHARSYQQIVESLNILSHCIIDIIPHGEGEARLTSACLPSLAAVSRNRLREDPKAKWVVQFHPLVTGSIDNVTYRQYNYGLMMSHSTQLARWLHKQLVLKYTFADFTKPFEMHYSTIRRDSGLLDGYGRTRDGLEALIGAFDELKERGVFRVYERKDVTGPRGKMLDVVLTIHPSLEFIREAKAANKRQGDGQRLLAGERIDGKYR